MVPQIQLTLTPNVMHIWGTVSSLNLSLPTDSNSTLDEYLFTFTCPTGGTTLTLPASIVWIQEPEFEEGKTYQVSIVNGLAGFLTNNMVAGGGSAPGTETDPIFKASPAYGIAASDITNWNGKQAALVSGTNIKTVNNESLLGSGNISIQGGGGDTNVIEIVKVNGTALTPDSNKAVDVPVPEKVSDIWNDLGYVSMNSVPQYETDPVFTASAAHGITSTDIANWNGKYSIPSGGIPASDIASGVIPTVPTNVSSFTNDANYVSSTNTVAIYSGSSAPSSSTGKNGDIYIQTS